MANYFVKTNGNDSNNGTTWALAKATVQAGMTLCSSAGDRCVVAAGNYNITAGLAPGTAGTSGSHSTLYGDYNGSIVDGSSATSGVSGFVVVDASVVGGNKGSSTVTPLAANNAWAYWDISNIWFTGGQHSIIAPTSGTPASNNIIDHCIFDSRQLVGLLYYGWANTASVIKNSIIFSNRGSTTATDNYAAFSYSSKITGFNTNPELIFDHCIIVSDGPQFYSSSTSSSFYTYTRFNSCTLMSTWRANTSNVAIYIADVNYNKVELNDCYVDNYKVTNQPTVVTLNAGCRTYLVNASAVASNLNTVALLPPIPLLFPASAIVDVLSSITSAEATDLWGTTLPVDIKGGANDYDVGAQELAASQDPASPNAAIRVSVDNTKFDIFD